MHEVTERAETSEAAQVAPVDVAAWRPALTDAALFSSILALVIAALGWISRLGFGSPVADVAMAAGMALFCVNLGAWMPARMGLAGPAAATLGAPFLLTLLGSAPVGAGALGLAVVAAGFALFVGTLVRTLTGPARGAKRTLVFLLAAACLGLWAAAVAWGTEVANPLFEEGSLVGLAHIDTLFHAAVAAMLRTFDVPTTGIDGLVRLQYHFGSHFCWGRLSNLLGLSTARFYGQAFAIVMIPMLIHAVLVLALTVRAARGRAPDAHRGNGWHWLCLAVVLVGVLPREVGIASGISLQQDFVSESFVLSLVVALSLLAVVAALFVSPAGAAARPVTPGWTAGVLLLALPLAALAPLKVSVYYQVVAALGWGALRLKLWRRWPVVAAFVVAIAVPLLTRRHYLPTQNTQGLFPLHYLVRFLDSAWVPLFFLAGFVWCWAYVALRLRETGARDLRATWASMRAGELLDLELVVIVVVIGLVPPMLVAMGSAGVYFVHFPAWLAASLVLASLPSPSPAPAAPVPFVQRPLAWTMRAGLVAFGVLGLFGNIVGQTVAMVRENLTLRLALAKAAGTTAGGSRAAIVAALKKRSVSAAIANATTGIVPAGDADPIGSVPAHATLQALRAFAARPRAWRRETALFVPQSNQAYWGLHQMRMTSEPFLAPTFAEMAMIDGVPFSDAAERLGKTWAYGYPAYRLRTAPQPELSVHLPDVRLRAKAAGFRRLVVMDATPGGDVVLTEHEL